MPMEWMIDTNELTKRYPSQQENAVSHLNLKIPRGQLFGLIGADGAGKTTTLRMLSTVMRATSGQIHVAGYDANGQEEGIRAHLGYMPQNFSLYPDLTVVENLEFFAAINHVPVARKRERISAMLAFTRLEGFTDRRAGTLSGGMKKKLALACALIHEPAVLLLDEPSTGVDPVSRRELWIILGRVVQQGVAVLVSTPYMDEAERCHQVAILNHGQILASGTPEALENSLPFEIVEVKAQPRKEMRRIVGETPGVLEWRPVGDRLRLATPGDTTDRLLEDLSQRFRQENLDVRLLRRARRSMEDVFVHMSKDGRGAK
jgi:ABC-2 type transport system ATP-binding protein